MLDDDVLHQGVDQRLQGDHIIIIIMGPSYETGAKADRQVVRLHHVFIAVLRHAEGMEQRTKQTLGLC